MTDRLNHKAIQLVVSEVIIFAMKKVSTQNTKSKFALLMRQHNDVALL